MLTLFHDFTSPASAIAVRRAQRLADEGLAVEFEGYEAVGIDMVLPVTLDVLAEIDGLTDVAAAEGVVLRRPANLPPTALCHVIGRIAEAEGRAAAWRNAAYTAFWQEGVDISDPSVLRDLAGTCDLDGDRVEKALSDRPLLAEVRRATARHRREGVGGVPTVLAQRTLVPGLLPIDDLRVLAEL